ncbi:MAG: hypothetical protein J0H30_00110 [Alphaproteobacteria bacterium]|nr:hypothetical protein [Alphaproteobacteria bacterium]
MQISNANLLAAQAASQAVSHGAQKPQPAGFSGALREVDIFKPQTATKPAAFSPPAFDAAPAQTPATEAAVQAADAPPERPRPPGSLIDIRV